MGVVFLASNCSTLDVSVQALLLGVVDVDVSMPFGEGVYVDLRSFVSLAPLPLKWLKESGMGWRPDVDCAAN